MTLKINAIKYDFYKRRMPELIERFPNLFNKTVPEPLAVGITNELVELTNFSFKEISALLTVWTSRHEYVMGLCSFGSRLNTAGFLTLVKPEHVTHAISRLEKYHLNMVATYARNFEIKYARKPFASVPEDKNPMFKEGFVPKPIPSYVAKLYEAGVFEQQCGDNSYVTRAFGKILGDTVEYGNHPFVDGADFRSSAVVEVQKIGDVYFVHTRNSTYMIIGELQNLEELQPLQLYPRAM